MNRNLKVLDGEMSAMKKDERDVMIQQLLHQNLSEISNEVERIKTSQVNHDERLNKVENDIKNKITLDYGQQGALQHMKKKRVEKLWSIGGEFQKVLDTKRKLHARAWSELYRTFGVSSYRDVKSVHFQEAMDWMEVWRPQIF